MEGTGQKSPDVVAALVDNHRRFLLFLKGRGTIPGVPDFTRKNSSLNKADAILIKHIWEGYHSPGSPMAMPPKGGNPSLTQEDIRKLLVYMRREFSTSAKK